MGMYPMSLYLIIGSRYSVEILVPSHSTRFGNVSLLMRRHVLIPPHQQLRLHHKPVHAVDLIPQLPR